MKVKLVIVVEGDPKALFTLALQQDAEEVTTNIPGLLHFTLDMYLIILSI